MEQIIRSYFANLRKTQYLPPEQLLLHQRELLDLLVRHARAHVPFYRDTGRLNVLFRRDDAINWERWSEIPPDARGITGSLRAAHIRSRSHAARPHRGDCHVRFHGRTGPCSPDRDGGALGMDGCGTSSGTVLTRQNGSFISILTPAQISITGVRHNAAWRPEFVSLNLLGEKIEVADTRPGAELLDLMASCRPRYLQVLPTVLEALILQDHHHVLVDLKLAAVFSFGEHFPSEAKLQSERYLDCKILELYGSSECNYIAGSCPYCGSFHVHAETVFVEAIDEDGSLVLPGETGQLLVTPLYNYGMPLIRYDHADLSRSRLLTAVESGSPRLTRSLERNGSRSFLQTAG